MSEKTSGTPTPSGEVPSFEVYRRAQYYAEHPEEATELGEKVAATESVASPAPQPREKRVYGDGIPTFITRQMVADLKEMGIADEAINKMTPSDALDMLR